MQGGHLDDEGEHIVDESVERLVHERLPRQVGDRLHLVAAVGENMQKIICSRAAEWWYFMKSCGVIMMKPKV
jgi:hypothetical protein